MYRFRLTAAAVVVAGVLAVVAPSVAHATALPDPASGGCDHLVTTPTGHDCLLPWPNDAFTKAAKTATGRQLNVTSAETPKNNSGVPIDPTYQDKLDGFSPGSEILIQVPNLDVTQTGIAPSTDIGSSLSTTAPIVLYDTVSKQRVPYFAELDAQNTDASTQLLLIHPAVDFSEGHRIDVLLRNLKNASGSYLPILAGEQSALAGTFTPKVRGAHLKAVVTTDLKSFDTSHLYVAWDFTVATGGGDLKKLSASNLADPALTMRQQAYALVGKTAPVFKVVGTSINGNGEYQVTGMYQVPTFLKNCPAAGGGDYGSTNTGGCAGMNVDKNGLPLLVPSSYNATTKTWSNQIWANFICVLPATPGATPATPVVYGHGLLGDASEVAGGNFSLAVNSYNMMGCATDWSGMSSNDLLLVAASLTNMSYFHDNVEHMLQGLVNQQFLGRLLNSPQGLASDPAFRSNGASRFAVGQTTYVGYSQGGIMGGALSAISNEWHRVVLGQTGLNYGGLLLNRSADWTEFASVYNPAYPNPTDQQIGLQLAQALWDRGENDGYAQHLTSNPYGGTTAKQVLLIEHYGDHQVSPVAAEVLGRTIHAAANQPAFANTYSVSGTTVVRTDPTVAFDWNMPTLSHTAVSSAAIVLWDFGSPTAPANNVAPTAGADPHDFGHSLSPNVVEFTTFLRTGIVPDVCGGQACQGPPRRS
jgi:hypothetical protein